MDLPEIESAFEASDNGVFMRRWGAAHKNAATYAQRKLCFVATDKAFLAGLLLDLSHRPDCYFVKYSVRPRDEMYLGRCFLLDDEKVGELWLTLKNHPKVMCTIQDDDFTRPFREAN